MSQVDFERRRHSRFNVDPIVCRTDPRVDGLCILKNVSITGAFFLNQTPPPVGSYVKIEFAEMPLEGYRINGRVVHHGLNGIRGFAVSMRSPRPRLLRAVYHADYIV
jgi:hypothetical protein